MSDIGKLWVQIVPSADGIGAELSNILVPAADSAGSEGGDSFIASMAKGIALGATALATALAAATGAAVKGAMEFAEYGDKIDKASQKMGMSAEAYQEWDAVMRHSGTSMDAMKSSMKTLSNAAMNGNEAFEAIGLSMEDVANMSQEDLFAATIAGLQNVEDTTERTYLAGQLLGRGATELGALLNTSSEDTQAMRDRVHELGGVLSDDAVKAAAAFQDNLQDMQTAMDGMKRNITAQFLPGINEIMAGITGLMVGDEGAAAQVKAGIESLITTVIEAIPEIANAAWTIGQAFIGAIIEIVPDLLQRGYEFVQTLGQGIMENLPSLISRAFEVISAFAGYLLQNLPTIAQKGVELIGSLAQGIMNNLPSIVAAIASGMGRLLATIGQNLPTFLQKGIELLGRVAAGIIQAVPQLIAKIPGILRSVASGFTSYNWGNIGSQIVSGIANGIRNGAKKVVDAAKNMAKNAFNAAKEFLGIHSPSTLFAYLGDMSVEGYRLEIDAGKNPISRTVKNTLSTAVGAGADALTSAYRTVSSPLSAYTPIYSNGTTSVYTIEVPVDVDGRQIARATATFTQDELNRLARNQNRRVGIA